MSSINQYDHSMTDTLLFGKAVIKQLNVDEPQIQKFFAKSDSASCYQVNYLPQALYQLCKEQDMLVRCDYNEPCKGKDQFNCECDGLKTILKSLNVDSVNWIFIALNKRKGLKNTIFLGLNLTKQNDIYQEIQILIFVVIIPFYFLMTASNSGNIWISVKVLLYLWVMQILFLVKL